MERSEDSIKGLTKLKMLITKLQRGLFSASREDGDGKSGGATVVPKDVKKGHFAVVAEKGGKPKRFVLELGYLSNPEFLSLLEQAEQEYGFQQKGILAVPCPPEELQNVLKYKKDIEESARNGRVRLAFPSRKNQQYVSFSEAVLFSCSGDE